MKEFDQADYEGDIVEVHRNLNQAKSNKDLYVWSVLKDGKLIGHTTDINLSCCFFKVSVKGRDRIVKKGQRDVCAWIVGVLSLDKMDDCDWRIRYLKSLPKQWFNTDHRSQKRSVHFNPFKSPDFTVDGDKIDRAESVSFKDNGCFV